MHEDVRRGRGGEENGTRQGSPGGNGTVESRNVPWMGFIFCSAARSFDACSHSFVIVRGGAGPCERHSAQRALGHEQKEAHTICTDDEVERRRRANGGRHAPDDLGGRPGGADGCTGAVGTERNVVRCTHAHGGRSAKKPPSLSGGRGDSGARRTHRLSFRQW